MRKKMSKIVVFVVLLLVAPIVALAIDAPHNNDTSPDYRGKVGYTSYTCDKCHNTHGVLGTTGYNNACTYCHNPSDPIAKTKPFTQVDVATPYASGGFGMYSGGLNPGKLKQTSHGWAGADVNPMAGSLAPTSPAMSTNLIANKLLCVRCHSVHNPYSSPVNGRNFLRVKNDNDEMCRDCHRPRDTQNQAVGSHPINLDYATSVAANPTKYNATPVSSNPSNPTASVKLLNGKVQCSTCHGIHYTDSNSGTTHTAAGFNNLSASPRGNLLRTDTFGKTAADNNICKNCHQHKNHNANTTNIQCNDCHSGHSDYISPADQAAGDTTINKYMLRRYVNYSSDANGANSVKLSTYRKRMVYKNSSSYVGANQTGTCQACHKIPTTVPQHTDPTYLTNTGKCQECHAHNAAAPNCNGCHGSPPMHTKPNSAATPYGYASSVGQRLNYKTGGAYKNESTAGHPSHAGGSVYPGKYNYACSQCHNNNTNSGLHNTLPNTAARFQYVFKDNTGVVAKTTITGGALPAPTPAYTTSSNNGTCSTIYCHSNGVQRTGQTLKYKTVTWASSRDTIMTTANRCVSCHNGVITGFNTMSTASHFRHVSNVVTTGKTYTCNVCHSATVSNNTTIANASNHVNGTIDLSFGATNITGLGTAWDSVGANCTTSYCHSNGKGSYPATPPNWSTKSTGACGTCHGLASAPVLATGTHSTHFTVVGTTTPTVVCAKCHTYTSDLAATHVNGTFDVVIAGCAAGGCHGTITPPAWGVNTTNNTCTKCHGTGTVSITASNYDVIAPSDATAVNSGQVSTNVKTGAHQGHLNYLNGFSNYSATSPSFYCQSCHGALPTTGTHSNGTSAPQFQLMANNRGAILTATWSAASVTCSNTYCHNPAGTSGTLKAANVGSRTFVSWTSTAYLNNSGKNQANCGRCHKSPGDAGFTTNLAGHTTDINTACNGCHGHNGDNTGTVAGQRHMDGVKYGGGGGCNGCHGYPPVPASFVPGVGNYADGKPATGNVNAGTYHVLNAHLDPTITAANAMTPCLPCHPDVATSGVHNQGNGTVITSNVNVFDPNDTTFRMDGSRSKRYYVNRTCGNVSCHYRPSPAWY